MPEGVWSVLKRSLANLAKRNLSQLTALVKTRLKPGSNACSTGPAFSKLPLPAPAWTSRPLVTSKIENR
jgi:hypothetical protein